MNKNYIEKLLNDNLRIDNRKLTDFRKPIKIELNISENAEGSARVIMGETEVIAGVKLNVDKPYSDNPDQGTIIVNTELLPMSSPDFETGPPSPQAVELSRIVDRGIRESKAIDFKKLCIKVGELVWIVFIDIYTINDAGNLIDAAALASIAALSQAKFPVLEDDKVKFGEFTNKKLPLTKLPITITLYKIGNHVLLDPTNEEESAVEARLSVAVTDDNIHAMQKGGEKGLKIAEIEKMIDIAVNKSKDLLALIK